MSSEQKIRIHNQYITLLLYDKEKIANNYVKSYEHISFLKKISKNAEKVREADVKSYANDILPEICVI